MTFEELMKELYKKDMEKIADFAMVKERIFPHLINAETNERFLAETPHKFLLDLPITYHVALQSPNGCRNRVITKDILRLWGKTINEIHDIAVSNLMKYTPTVYRDLTDMLSKMLGITERIEGGPIQTYVLTSSAYANGAAVLLDTHKLDEIVKKLGDFYILPSSIHEVIILPVGSVSLSKLESIVQEVNGTCVKPSDRLNNYVYMYSAFDGFIRAR